MNLSRLERWHQTKKGLVVFGLVELVVAYLLASWAIDSGNVLVYFLTFVLAIGALQNFYKSVRSSLHGRRA